MAVILALENTALAEDADKILKAQNISSVVVKSAAVFVEALKKYAALKLVFAMSADFEALKGPQIVAYLVSQINAGHIKVLFLGAPPPELANFVVKAPENVSPAMLGAALYTLEFKFAGPPLIPAQTAKPAAPVPPPAPVQTARPAAVPPVKRAQTERPGTVAPSPTSKPMHEEIEPEYGEDMSLELGESQTEFAESKAEDLDIGDDPFEMQEVERKAPKKPTGMMRGEGEQPPQKPHGLGAQRYGNTKMASIEEIKKDYERRLSRPVSGQSQGVASGAPDAGRPVSTPDAWAGKAKQCNECSAVRTDPSAQYCAVCGQPFRDAKK